MAYKVFTNGSVLNASEINENLMNQAIAVFSNASARTAAITSPVEGQLTYLEDTAAYESFDGSSWVALTSASGLTLISTTSFSAASSVSLSAGTFTSTYDNYKILIDISVGSAIPASTLQYRMRASGSDDSTSNYQNATQGLKTDNNGSSIASFNQNAGSLIFIPPATPTELDLTIYSPALTRHTTISGTSFSVDSSNNYYAGYRNGSRHSVSTSYDSITFYPSSGSITGKIAVYGLGI